MKITVEKDGSLTTYEQGPQQLDAKGAPVVDANGQPVYTGRSRAIGAGQIAAHRRDPDFEAALQAAAADKGAAPELVAIAAAKA